jgi:hypothetical protein
MSGARAAEHRTSDHAWREANNPQAKHGPTLRKSGAAVDAAKANISDWLASSIADSPSSPAELVGSLGEIVSTDVFNALCSALDAENKNKIKVEYAKNHFFCSLMAELACSMQEFKDNLDQAIKKIADSIISYSAGRKDIKIPPIVADVASQAAVEGLHKLIDNLPALRNFNDLLQAARILAIMMCPAPEKHEVVIRCCFKPLGAPIVSDIAKERLTAAMPAWMNGGAKLLGVIFLGEDGELIK